MKIGDAKAKKVYSLLLLGAPKVGKTTLATQFPRPYIIDLDGNMGGPADYIQREKLKLDVQWDTVNVDESGKTVPRPARYDRFYKLFVGAMQSPNFDTIVFDSTTTLNEVLMDRVRVLQGRPIAPPPSPEPSRVKDGQLEIQDWGAFAGLWYNLIMDAKAYGKHLIFNSHTVIDKGADGVVRETINIPGKTAGYMPGLFSDVWMLTKEEKYVGGKATTVRFIQQSPADSSQRLLGLGTSAWTDAKKELDLKTLMTELGFTTPPTAP